ncbi:MAG: argininosuccinate synthase [Acidimicrobiia bacterium]|nr:argininosuccinate synthase [Acidimicrobiia bacterium]
MAKRVVLAYSGGLDTSIAVRWMREHWGVEVVCCAVDVGQMREGESDVIHRRAEAAGAVEVEVIDARDEFAAGFLVPALRANAMYEGKYPLVSALSRPVIVEHLVASARRHGADAVGHGCTGKGNDQVRFEVSTRALAPDLEVLAPVRTWGLTRADCIDLAHQWGIPIEATKEKLYSIDENMWGRAIECGVLENPWSAPPSDPFTLTRDPGDAPSEPREIIVGFEAGAPVSLDGEAVSLVEMIDALGTTVGAYGFGRIDMVENRRVGIKSREVYECPASLALILAHQDLEGVTLERDVAREKQRLEIRVAELIYDGLWHSPLMRALDAFMVSTQEHVTGEVRLRLEPGRCYAAGRRAPRGLYDHDLATYDASDAFRHEDSDGFVRLWGLSVETWSRRQGPGATS